MADPVPIYKGRDFYIPAFEVRVGGANLPKEARKDILEVKYSDTIDQFDTFELTVSNWDEARGDFKYTGSASGRVDRSRDELYDPGQEIELWMGYRTPLAQPQRTGSDPEPLRLMLAGVITKLAPNFPASGAPTLKITGTNALIKMITEQRTHTYPANMRDSEIAEDLSNRSNLTLGNLRIGVRTDARAKSAEPQHPEPVLQANQYDILFLLQLAHRNGYDLVLRQENRNGSVEQYLYFGPSTEHPPVIYLLEWGKSLASFQPTLTTARQVNELTVRGWDSQRRQAINVTVNRGDLPTQGLHDEDRLYRIEQGLRGRHEVVVDQPFRNEAESRRYALDRLERLSKDMVTARGTTFGTPDLRAGRKCRVDKLGRTFNGEYFIKSTTHTIGSGGYTTEFEARLEEERG